jgi:hypothetical protein
VTPINKDFTHKTCKDKNSLAISINTVAGILDYYVPNSGDFKLIKMTKQGNPTFKDWLSAHIMTLRPRQGNVGINWDQQRKAINQA